MFTIIQLTYLLMFGKIVPVEQLLNIICRGIEVVITGLTRNPSVSVVVLPLKTLYFTGFFQNLIF